jgi:hypothetical protein
VACTLKHDMVAVNMRHRDASNTRFIVHECTGLRAMELRNLALACSIPTMVLADL